MVLKSGDKILVVHRRLFEKDSSRFFAGLVERFDSGLVVVTGYTFAQDKMTGHVHKKEDPRTKVLAIGAGTIFVYLLACDARIETLQFVHSGSTLILTDSQGFEMDLTER